MSRRIVYVAAIAFCAGVTIPISAVPALKEREQAAALKKETEAIQGTWYTVSSADRDAVGGEDKNHTITYEGNRWSQKRNGQEYQAGTFELGNVLGNPKHIDYICTDGQQRGMHFRAIYEFQGEKLVGCSDHGEDNRPTEFSGAAGFLHVAKRVEK